MSLIPERVWALLTDAERENLEAFIEGWKFSPTVRCPTCDTEIGIRLKITAGAVFTDGREKTPPKAVAARSAADAAVLEAAKTSGVMSAFVEAVKAEKEHGGVPADLDLFFLHFWKSALPTRVSSIVLASWIEDFGGEISVLQGQGILAVLSDGLLMTFVPNRLTQPARLSSVRGAKVSNAAGFDMWRRSRFGYVPVEARSFGTALRQRNIGAFGAIVQ